MTKSPLVLEDLSLLKRIHERSLAMVVITMLTTDHTLSERLEAKAAAPALRLHMIEALKRAGIPVGVAMVPLIPYVNDTEYATQRLLHACLESGADFVFWDSLHIPNRKHHLRIQDMLMRVGNYPASYYRDIYGDQPLPNANYRTQRNREILRRCDRLGLEPHVPHHTYAGRIAPRNEAAALLKHAALRNMLNGHYHMAARHHELSDLAYRGEAAAEHLRTISLWNKLQPLLG
jgi:DNA repair photolyase